MVRRAILVLAVACALTVPTVALTGCGKAAGTGREERSPKTQAKTPAEKDAERLQAYVDGQFTEQMRQESDAWYAHLEGIEVVEENGGKIAIARTSLDERGAVEDAENVGEFLLRNDVVPLDSVKVLSSSGQLLVSVDSSSD